MDNSYWFQVRVRFPPIPGEWKNPYNVFCSLPVELLLEWTNTLTGTKQPKLVRSIRLSWVPWLYAYSIRCKQQWWHAVYMHMHTSCFSPWIRGSEHFNSVDTSRSFAFPIVPGLIVTFLMLWYISKQASLSLALYLCPEETVRKEHTCHSNREHSYHLWHAIKMYLFPLLCSRSNKNNLGMVHSRQTTANWARNLCWQM